MQVALPSLARSNRAAAARTRLPRPEPMLTRHALLEPLGPPSWFTSKAPLEASGGAVWRPAPHPGDSGGKLLTLRHFAVQAVQLKLERLLRQKGIALEPAAAWFVSPQTDHVYADPDTFRRLVAYASPVRGAPGQLPAFIDAGRRRLIIDTSRFFEGHNARLTAAAVQALAAILESRRFAAYPQEHPQLLGCTRHSSQVVAASLALRATTGCIARCVLQEPGLALSPLARQLLRRAGSTVVTQALLSGSPDATHATVVAFAALWRHWLQARDTNRAAVPAS